MHIFRSEEHARKSPQFDPAHEKYIQPLATWLDVFSSEVFRNRNRDDFVSWFQANHDQLLGEILTKINRF